MANPNSELEQGMAMASTEINNPIYSRNLLVEYDMGKLHIHIICKVAQQERKKKTIRLEKVKTI